MGLCGLGNAIAGSFALMLMLRFITGLCIGVIFPGGMGIIVENFQGDALKKAMAGYGLTLSVGGILAPIAGGWFVDNYSWRTVYLSLAVMSIPGLWLTAKVPESARPATAPKLDYMGLLFIFMGFGGLQWFVAEGTQYDWLDHPYTLSVFLMSMVGFGCFTIHCLTYSNPIIDLRVMKFPNMAAGGFGMFALVMSQYGVFVAYPMLTAGLYGYSSYLVGLVNGIGGIGAIFGTLIGGTLATVLRTRPMLNVVVLGIVTSMYAYGRMHSFYSDTTFGQLSSAIVIFMVGAGMIQYAFMSAGLAWLPRSYANAGSALQNVLKFTGAGVGAGIAGAIGSGRQQFHTTMTGEILNPYNPSVNVLISSLSPLDQAGLQQTPATAAMAASQAVQVGYLTSMDLFFVFGILTLTLVPWLPFFNEVPTQEQKAKIEEEDARRRAMEAASAAGS